jgi:hypothetical protein
LFNVFEVIGHPIDGLVSISAKCLGIHDDLLGVSMLDIQPRNNVMGPGSWQCELKEAVEEPTPNGRTMV